VKIYEGDFTSFYPHYKQGDFLFYFPNGVVRRKLSYKNNKPKKAVDFFENGKIHRVYDILEFGTIIYKLVYNEDDVNVLDARGSGSEMFLDAITGKKITYEYENQKLKSAYFTDSNGEKVYQVCENNAEIKKIKNLQKLIKEKVNYPVASIQNSNHGYVLLKCIIDPSGIVSEIKLIKGIDADCDKAILDFGTCFKNEVYWNPGKVEGKAIKQEIILPIDFSIIETSSYRNHYYNFNTWFFQNMMIQQNMMMQQNMMRAPMGRI
jgi:antitoxin component YwqK of YwqJK toxin-antitoxin module